MDQGTSTRQKYGLTERDEATGLDHTWFRKHENAAGRWTSPDPYGGSASLGSGQSWNRYAYVEGDPLNWVDPSGLNMQAPRPGTPCSTGGRPGIIGEDGRCYAGPTASVDVGWSDPTVRTGGAALLYLWNPTARSSGVGMTVELGGGGSTDSQGGSASPPNNADQKKYNDCVDAAWRQFRRQYLADGATAAAGGAIIIGGLVFARWLSRTPHAREHGVTGSVGAVNDARSVNLPSMTTGIAMIKSVVERNEAKARDERIEKCNKQYPNAKHHWWSSAVCLAVDKYQRGVK